MDIWLIMRQLAPQIVSSTPVLASFIILLAALSVLYCWERAVKIRAKARRDDIDIIHYEEEGRIRLRTMAEESQIALGRKRVGLDRERWKHRMEKEDYRYENIERYKSVSASEKAKNK